MSPVKSFPFHRLSTELAIEIIRHASTPDFAAISIRNPYSQALILCLVSHAVRQATMPQLLDTVLLSEGRNVYAFIRAILRQREHHRQQSRLAVDYPTYVRKMWCGTCWEVLVDEPRDSASWLDYDALWDVIRNVESLGINCQSTHLLYNSLAAGVARVPVEAEAAALPQWKCRRVTFAGDYCRWRPLTSTAEGSAFLSRITHLVLWMPDPYHEREGGSSKTSSEVTPRWMENVPFGMMESLTDVAFVLSRPRRPVAPGSMVVPTEMLAYHCAENNARMFQRWAVDDGDPASHGMVIPLNIEVTADEKGVVRVLDWEKAWVTGQSEY